MFLRSLTCFFLTKRLDCFSHKKYIKLKCFLNDFNMMILKLNKKFLKIFSQMTFSFTKTHYNLLLNIIMSTHCFPRHQLITFIKMVAHYVIWINFFIKTIIKKIYVYKNKVNSSSSLFFYYLKLTKLIKIEFG